MSKKLCHDFFDTEIRNLSRLALTLKKKGCTIKELAAEGRKAKTRWRRADGDRTSATYAGLAVVYGLAALTRGNKANLDQLAKLIGQQSQGEIHFNAKFLNTLLKSNLGVDTKYASKLATVLRFALCQKKKIPATGLQKFINNNGGLDKCALAFRERLREHGAMHSKQKQSEQPKPTSSAASNRNLGKSDSQSQTKKITKGSAVLEPAQEVSFEVLKLPVPHRIKTKFETHVKKSQWRELRISLTLKLNSGTVKVVAIKKLKPEINPTPVRGDLFKSTQKVS